jgi:hypothetical protein
LPLSLDDTFTDIAPDGDAAPVPDAQDPPDNANQAPGDEGPGEPAAGDDDQAPAAGEDDRMGEAGSGAT